MLRTRLFLNLVPFVVILLAVGVYAIVLFSRLANSVDLVVMKNYQSVFSAQSMALALSGMQHGVMHAPQFGQALGRQIFDQHAETFETNLTLLVTGIASVEDQAVCNQLEEGFATLRQTAARMLVETNAEVWRNMGNDTFFPTQSKLSLLLRGIRDRNHNAIYLTKTATARIVRDVTRLMVLGMAVALVLASYACFQLSRAILTPIQALTRATRELSEGDLSKPVPVASSDELGQLAMAFNTMAGLLHEHRQSTSERIIRLHRTMETTLASFPDPIFVLNHNSAVELKNPAATDLAEALGSGPDLPETLKKIAARVLVENRDYLPDNFAAALQLTVRSVQKFYLPRVVQMRDRESAILGVAVVLYDVTRFRLLDDAKSNLVATVSHELKTPLTGIRMALHLLAHADLGPMSPKQSDLVMTARNDTERLLRILNDLLDLTRLEEGKSGLLLEGTLPRVLVEGAAAALRESARSKGVELQVECDPDLPLVKVDAQRLSHVFSNLVSNAIRYSPHRGVIRVCAARGEEEAVRFSVIDEGPGVPEEHRHRVFERFYRVPGQTNSGAGLGLSIAREIVLAHGGRIGFRNGPDGRGSEFFFILPPCVEAPMAELLVSK